VAGPREQHHIIKKVPPGEAQRVYAPGDLAQEVRNLVVTEEHTLRAIRRGCLYEAHWSSTGKLRKNTPGLFHAGLDGGMSEMLLVRSGQYLYRHTGWDQNWEVLAGGLSDDQRSPFPDQFVVINNMIVWSNGIDRPLVITGDGGARHLGFQDTPAAPMSMSPTRSPLSMKLSSSTNANGYGVYGRIGTSSDAVAASSEIDFSSTPHRHGTIAGGSVDPLKAQGIVDRMMTSRYYYYVQYEDSLGNLGPLSARSNAATIFAERTYPNMGVNIDDIKRQLAVKTTGELPDNAVAVRIYRTPDVMTVSHMPRYLTRVPGTYTVLYPDNVPDAELGAEAKEYVQVPVFKIAAAYQGRLVVANFSGDEAAIRVSDPGFPGTFQSHMYAVPDTGGAEVTGLYSAAGALFAFTRTSMYTIEIVPEGILFTPVATGVGCVAPQSIRGTNDGGMIWLSADGFMKLKDGKVFSISSPISKTIRSELNRSRMTQAAAVVDPETGEYRCIVSRTGSSYNDLMLCFGEQGWRRMDLGWNMSAICTTDDERRLTLIAASPNTNPEGYDAPKKKKLAASKDEMEVVAATHEIVVFDRERRGMSDFNLDFNGRESVYRSAWMRADEVGLMPFNVRTMYIGMLDSNTARGYPSREAHDAAWDRGDEDEPLYGTGEIEIRFYKNGSWKQHGKAQGIHGWGTDRPDSMHEDFPEEAVLNKTAKVADRKPFWRKVNPDLRDVDTWAFEIRAPLSMRLRLQAFAFDISTAGGGTPMGRIPRGDDT
jgi:hypothetical protein